jgi:YHS domain-containing protein
MNRNWIFGLLVVVLLIGCGEQKAQTEIEKAMAALSTQDRALAEAQKDCPVSGEPLGSMGAPIKLDVKGQAVFICCEGCRKKLLRDPDTYLAKLKK